MDKGPPQLDDQNCFAQGTSPKDKGSSEVTDVVDDHDNIFESGIDCYEELAKMKKASRSHPIPDEERSPEGKDSGKGSSTDKISPAKAEADTKPKAKAEPKPFVGAHDPSVMPGGTPVPLGYNCDGVRLVRSKNGVAASA